MSQEDKGDTTKKESYREALKNEAIGRYGEYLGRTFFNYVFGNPKTPEAEADQRNAFATEIASARRDPNFERGVKAETAVLEAIEIRSAQQAAKHAFPTGFLPR